MIYTILCFLFLHNVKIFYERIMEFVSNVEYVRAFFYDIYHLSTILSSKSNYKTRALVEHHIHAAPLRPHPSPQLFFPFFSFLISPVSLPPVPKYTQTIHKCSVSVSSFLNLRR